MALQLYNSLTRRTEEFRAAGGGAGGDLCLRPTVYRARAPPACQELCQFPTCWCGICGSGLQRTLVQKSTDVGHLTDDADAGEDKIAKAARTERKHPMALAESYTRSFLEDMDRLNCVRPDISPRASGHIIEQIELVKTLLDKGFAYEAGGSVYFDITKFRDYGKLSGRDPEEMMAGARIEVSAENGNATRPISPCGRRPSRTTSCSGPAPGAWAIPAGTSNAPPCP